MRRASVVPATYGQADVVSTEAERIAERQFDRTFDHASVRVFEVAVRVRALKVDGGRDLAGPARLDARDRLKSRGRPQQVSGHGLGGAHHRLVGVITQH